MRDSIKVVALGLALTMPLGTSIAASKSPKLARCDGKQRRPANIYGSILPTVDPASSTVTPASAVPSGVDVFPDVDPAKPIPRGAKSRRGGKPETQVPPISAISPPTAYGSC